MKRLSNISISEYEEFLLSVGCKKTRSKGGHNHWTRKDLLRPITIQSHIDPVPEFIIKNGLRILNRTKKDFLSFFNKK